MSHGKTANVDSIEIDSDEGGWRLKVVTIDGERYDFRIHGVAFEFAGSPGLRDLLEWRGEGESVRAEVRAARMSGLDMAEAMEQEGFGPITRVTRQLTWQEKQELARESYAPDDPKSPGYADRMADIWDAREGK